MDYLENVYQAQEALRIAEKEYMENTAPCTNTECGLHVFNQRMNCKWTTTVTECRDYTAD